MATCANIILPSDVGGSLTCAQLESSLAELKTICEEVNTFDPLQSFTVQDQEGGSFTVSQGQAISLIDNNSGLRIRALVGNIIFVEWEVNPPGGTSTSDYVYVYNDVLEQFAWVSIKSLAGLSGVVSQGEFNDDAQAALAGVNIGEYYDLSASNIYGLPYGLVKKRTV